MVALPNASGNGSLMLLIWLSSSHSSKMVGHTALGAQQRHLITLPYQNGKERLFFPGSAPPNDTGNSESVVGVESGDFPLVTRHQVDKFTCIWLVEHGGAKC